MDGEIIMDGGMERANEESAAGNVKQSVATFLAQRIRGNEGTCKLSCAEAPDHARLSHAAIPHDDDFNRCCSRSGIGWEKSGNRGENHEKPRVTGFADRAWKNALL
jgi:hypothetical protein